MLEAVLGRAQPIIQPFLDVLPRNLSQKARIIALEGYATLRHVLPLSLHWFYQRYITQKIVDVTPLEIKTGHVAMRAFLYRHGEIKREMTPLLLVHGDYGHPFSLLHFAEEAKREKEISVFSLYLPEIHRNDRLSDSSDLMKAAIDKIQNIVRQQKVRIVAHSKGTILAADRILVKKDASIESLFAVGGRFHLPDGDESCKPLLRPLVSDISDAIQQREKPHKIVSIAPKEDWNAPRAAMTRGLIFHEVEGGHLSALYERETTHHFHTFLNQRMESSSSDLLRERKGGRPGINDIKMVQL